MRDARDNNGNLLFDDKRLKPFGEFLRSTRKVYEFGWTTPITKRIFTIIQLLSCQEA
jgi:hypothetical protein